MLHLKFFLNPRLRNRKKQSGASLMFFVLIITVVSASVIFSYLESGAIKNSRDKTSIAALAEAKNILLGFAIRESNVVAAYLPNPDLKITGSEGSEAGNAGAQDISLIGKFPWRSLGSPPLKDGWGECLWYVVSGRFKKSPKTDVLNWDTQGQIDVIDSTGNYLASNLAAVIVSPGPVLDGQNRSLSPSDLPNCGGNYDARNYLDSYAVVNAIGGEVNYFSGSTNNRQATNTSNKTFVLASNDYYNDHFLFISTDEIFQLFIRRSDFSTRISDLMDDPAFTTIAAFEKDSESLDCFSLAPSNQDFCKNWKEMLLLTALTVPSPITIDGALTGDCTRVLIFGGRRVGTQTRQTAADKANAANYIEGANLTSFENKNGGFDGVSTFDPDDPGADILRCI